MEIVESKYDVIYSLSPFVYALYSVDILQSECLLYTDTIIKDMHYGKTTKLLKFVDCVLIVFDIYNTSQLLVIYPLAGSTIRQNELHFQMSRSW